MDRLNNDNEEEQQEPREEIESMGKFFSGAYIGRMFFIVGALLLLIDCVGLFFTYQYVDFRPWQLVAFYLAVAALFIDSTHNFYQLRALKAESADVTAILLEQLDDMDSPWTLLSLVTIGVKLLLAVLLAGKKLIREMNLHQYTARRVAAESGLDFTAISMYLRMKRPFSCKMSSLQPLTRVLDLSCNNFRCFPLYISLTFCIS